MDISEAKINSFLGDMDIHLMDLILKGELSEPATLLDVGCGSGRNLVYFLNRQWTIWAIDTDRSQLELLRYLFQGFAGQDPQRLVEASAESIPLASEQFDLIICSRVLHLLPSERAFWEAWAELHRLLKRGGTLYFSMNSQINFDSHVFTRGDLSEFKDGTKGFFLKQSMIADMEALGYRPLMSHRTVHFEDQHAETTMILKKT